ncbi:MAG: HlyD family efflux transporter periplasmic adaptor subunit [Bacteroidales bacterium]|nr:HlyD family efflux transporter periplasmic adaptor subunit [Bacteroidales bacterium]
MAAVAISCGRNGTPDDYGIVGFDTYTVASSETGQIVALNVTEGSVLEKDDVVGLIDTTRLSLQLNALVSQANHLRNTLPNVGKQVDVLMRQKESLENEKGKVTVLVERGSASSKQLDRINDEISVLESQIDALRSSLSRENSQILSSISALEAQASIVRDQIEKCSIINPENGVVTAKYVNLHEFIAPGQPIYRLADNTNAFVDAWFEGGVLSTMKLGDNVTVKIDDGDSKMRSYTGRVSYIAENAEYTPTKVQTRDTRTTMVYHVKIKLTSDGYLKSGMPAEIYLESVK